MYSNSLSYHQPEVLRLQGEREVIPEGGRDCSDEAMLMSSDKDTLPVRMAAHSALVNELVLAPSPRCIRVAIRNLFLFIFELVSYSVVNHL